MSATVTHERTGWQHIWSRDGIQVYGSTIAGWHVLLPNGVEVAHDSQPELDAIGALALYRKQWIEAEDVKERDGITTGNQATGNRRQTISDRSIPR